MIKSYNMLKNINTCQKVRETVRTYDNIFEIITICKKNSLNLKTVDGISFNPIIDKWNISIDKSVNYIAKFKKN